MKRIIIAIATVALSLTALSNNANAQTGWYAGIHGGIIYSGNENTKYGEFAELLNGTALFSVGYDFDNLWGARVMGGYGANTSASNWKEYSQMFDNYVIDYYTLKDFSAFIDGTLNLSYLMNKRTDNAVVVKAYAGVGAAYAWGYGDTRYDIYKISDTEQFALAGRVGVNAEYMVSNKVGALVDASLTALQDNFNGVDAGLSYDARATVSFGLVYHF